MARNFSIGKGNGIVGDIPFIEWVKERFLDNVTTGREQPALRELRKKSNPQELIEHFAHRVGRDKKEICKRGKKTIERAMLMELLYRFCQLTQPKIGKILGGIDYSAVSQSRKRLRVRLEKDKKLNKKFNNLCDQLLQKSRIKI